MNKFLKFCVDRPKTITVLMLVTTLSLGLLAALPTLRPQAFPSLHPLKVDTDPENMLPPDEPVRLFHHEMKKEFSLHDMVVLGVVNEVHPEGVFNPESLKKIHDLAEFAKTLRWADEKNPSAHAGVVEVDLIAPSTVDNIEQGGLGLVKFEWLMAAPPGTPEEAVAIRHKAERLPFLQGTVLSEDGKALALYLPLTSKDMSYRVSAKLQEKIDTFRGDERFFITGLPVAEDTFGVEMFKQMAISAPLAMLVIFLLMFYFFRKFSLILSPMIVAVVSVICTMGLLVATGHTVHIMSSMIPIFIMPIAVLDAIHILSDFFDRYQETKDRRKTILAVMDTLFMPMFYTTLTTAVGFASLALTPIPPVQVFGLFVAFGVLVAWIWTVAFIPAYVMFIPAKSLENFGLVPHEEEEAAHPSLIVRLLAWTGQVTVRYAKGVLAGTLILASISAYGISKITINDNPVKWFHASHPIRVADHELNKHFGGTYMAFLALESKEKEWDPSRYTDLLVQRLKERSGELRDFLPGAPAVFEGFLAEAKSQGGGMGSKKKFLNHLEEWADGQGLEASKDDAEAWDEVLLFIDEERQRDEVFKQPEVLAYVSALQERLLATGVVGKSNSLSDLVKTVHRELLLGKEEEFRLPDSSNGVAQTLITFQNSHRPNDLWHFVTPDFKKTSLWVQLKSGDNMQMAHVVRELDEFVAANPPPVPLEHRWFGLTYINVIWQDKMVSGMMQSFLGSFLVVLLMMTVLFRSSLWGLLSMLPLTLTIGLIYGLIGLAGKDYDMPVAVLSSLSLGLAVDYAIHFLARGRSLQSRYGSWSGAVGAVFGEPARAIARNVIVVGMGFLPLLAAPLVPYQTVGLFIAAILITAGAASLLLLPALITLLEKWLFPQTDQVRFTCKCGTCIITGVLLVAVVAMNVNQFLSVGWTTLTWVSLAAILAMMGICQFMARRQACKT